MKTALATVAVILATVGIARAQATIVLDEMVSSWQGDDEIQYIELRMLGANLTMLANTAALVFDDATGSADGRRTAFFTQNVTRGVVNAKILVASTKARDLASVQPDFLLPAGFFHVKAGRVCFAANGNSGLVLVDCVAYGAYTGDNGTFGAPTPLTPDNRALQRMALKGRNRADWTSVLDPVLENNAGATGTLPATLCGDDIISQGEECDGTALAGATCASLGFAKGKLVCTQCHFDTTGCTTCGNDAINGKEECDGGDLGDRTCASLGYTGGDLACSDTCTLDLTGCDPAFFVPGGGPPKTDCLGEWRVASATGGPDAKGHVVPKVACKDGRADCDADGAANGTCVFTVSACFSRDDARFTKCPATAISAWTLLGKVDPADPTVSALVSAVAAIGPSTVDGVAVAFSPALAEADTCSASVAVSVAAGRKLALRARTAGPAGKPRDVDVLRLACTR
jgi:hypothetical protein